MKNKRKIDICLSPFMIDLFDLSNKRVIILDVFRATSAMCVFLNNGGSEVIPVSTVQEAKQYKNKINNDTGHRYLVAAERNGSIVPGFDLGNSPLLYDRKNFKGLSLVITTTNGTLAIEKSKKAGGGMLLGSFLNANAVCDYISSKEEDLLIVCSGWNGRFCIEDLLLGGLLADQLLLNSEFYSNSDTVLLAKNMYEIAKINMFKFLSQSSYRKRMDLDEDVKFCLRKDIMRVVPVWRQDNSDIGIFSLDKKKIF